MDRQIVTAMKQGIASLQMGSINMILWGSHVVQKVFQEQSAIGWFPMLYGFLSSKWSITQEQYFHCLPQIPSKQRCIKRWRKAIFLKCLGIAWDMWEHRNEVKHGAITPQKQRLIDTIESKIRSLFAGGVATLSSRHKHWLTHRPQSLCLILFRGSSLFPSPGPNE